VQERGELREVGEKPKVGGSARVEERGGGILFELWRRDGMVSRLT
jgi:hypothetical protein